MVQTLGGVLSRGGANERRRSEPRRWCNYTDVSVAYHTGLRKGRIARYPRTGKSRDDRPDHPAATPRVRLTSMGVQELGIILVIVLLIFGGSQLPKLARNLGQAQKEFKDGLSQGEADAAKRALDAKVATEATASDETKPPTTPA